MKKKITALMLALVMCVTLIPMSAFAAFNPSASYGAPTNVGLVFNKEDLDSDPSSRYSFEIGYAASNEIRALTTAGEDGSFEEAGFDSLGITAQADYKIDSIP
ncbi:MAG: hypothetical protein VB084_06960 [Syntrophomonadaceae bacterium]|nr:hypothetical protein [Syntrophomonadaceae bacterium]